MNPHSGQGARVIIMTPLRHDYGVADNTSICQNTKSVGIRDTEPASSFSRPDADLKHCLRI